MVSGGGRGRVRIIGIFKKYFYVRGFLLLNVVGMSTGMYEINFSHIFLKHPLLLSVAPQRITES